MLVSIYEADTYKSGNFSIRREAFTVLGLPLLVAKVHSVRLEFENLMEHPVV